MTPVDAETLRQVDKLHKFIGGRAYTASGLRNREWFDITLSIPTKELPKEPGFWVRAKLLRSYGRMVLRALIQLLWDTRVQL